jgi:hypothetical protein
MRWHRFGRLPGSVKLHYRAPDGKHPLTPVEIRQRYVKEVEDLALVVWYHAATVRFGFKTGIDEVAWPRERLSRFELSFCRPAKGLGYVWLSVHDFQKEGSVLSSDHFTPELLEWFRSLSLVLSGMFSVEVIEEDCGADC